MELSMWSNFYYDLSLEESLRRIKKSGFNSSEISDSHFIKVIENNEFDRFIEIKEKLDIKTPQIHAPICSIYEDPKKNVVERLVDFADKRKEIRKRETNCIIEWIKYCKIVGIDCIVVHPGGIKGYDEPEEYKKIELFNIECFKRIAESCNKNGIKIGIENMGGKGMVKKYMPYQKAEQILELIEKVGSKYIGICLDTSHANISKINIPEFIKIAKEKIYATHISDNLGENDDHLCPFSGRINWIEVMDAFKSINFNGVFNFEIPGEVRCPLEVRDIKIKSVHKIGTYLKGVKNDRDKR